MKRIALLTFALLTACGSDPPAKSANDANDAPPTVAQGGGSHTSGGGGGGGLTVGQELGSIDQRAVEVMTNRLLNGKLESVCHKQGRDRLEYMTGDMKMFFRISAQGKVKYSYFEDSTVGDRDTEKCVLDAFANADWPKPIAGEAEVRNGFGWTPGGERAPSTWSPEKVTGALEKDKDAQDAVNKCVGTAAGGFKVTAYVEPGEVEGKGDAAATPTPDTAKKPGGKKSDSAKKPGDKKAGDKKGAAAAPELDHGGKFKAIGVAVTSKDNADKIDCLVDALKTLSLPSPGSYVAKVSFSL